MTPPALFTIAATPIEERASTSDYHAARSAGWAWQRDCMARLWLAKLRETSDPARIAFIQERLDYLRSVDE